MTVSMHVSTGQQAAPRDRPREQGMPERQTHTHPLLVSYFQATVKCRECGIFIGTSREDQVPLPSPDGLGYLCRSCWQSVRRRARSTTIRQLAGNSSVSAPRQQDHQADHHGHLSSTTTATIAPMAAPTP